MGVYELSGAGSIKTGRTLYTSMNAGNQYGAMVPIASTTLTSVSNPSFYNIPQTYQDLMIVANVRGTNASALDTLVVDWVYVNQYSNTLLTGDGSSATSTRNTSQYGATPVMPGGNATAGVFGSIVVHILNYANTTTAKTALFRSAADSNGSGQTMLGVAMRANTSAISYLDFGGANAPLAIGSTITLYGIRAVSS